MRQNRSVEDYIKYVVEETKPNIKLILMGQSCSDYKLQISDHAMLSSGMPILLRMVTRKI